LIDNYNVKNKPQALTEHDCGADECVSWFFFNPHKFLVRKDPVTKDRFTNRSLLVYFTHTGDTKGWAAFREVLWIPAYIASSRNDSDFVEKWQDKGKDWVSLGGNLGKVNRQTGWKLRLLWCCLCSDNAQSHLPRSTLFFLVGREAGKLLSL
jgi:hypothetical protein